MKLNLDGISQEEFDKLMAIRDAFARLVVVSENIASVCDNIKNNLGDQVDNLVNIHHTIDTFRRRIH